MANDSVKALKRYSPKLISEVTTLEAAQRMQLPSIARIKKESGEQARNKLIVAMIHAFQSSLNIERVMSVAQMQDAAEIIGREYYWMNLADLNVILTQGRMGRMGEMFGKFDITTLCTWIDKYATERMEYHARQSIDRHNEHKSEIYLQK